MKYLSVKQTAEKWKVSPAMVRRYCLQGRIKGAVMEESGWKVPEKAKKPASANEPPVKEPEISPLAKKLIAQKKKKHYHGLYDFVQIYLTYCSCRMASGRLTQKQVEQIFRKGKVSDMFEAVKISDVIETMNHCVCVDYVLDNVATPLTSKFIKKLHCLLFNGTVDERKERVIPGEHRTAQSKRKETFMTSADLIATEMKDLLDGYELNKAQTLEDVLDFHVHFETIFPFEDGNGRIGRLLMFKECLRHGVTPFILDDKRRSRYLEGIRQWHENRTCLLEVVQEAQDRFVDQESLQSLLAMEDKFLPVHLKQNK